MPAAKVEKYKLTPEQVAFSKKFKQVKNLSNVLRQGIMYKASEMQQLQQLSEGVDLRIQNLLQQAPTDFSELAEQPSTEQLVINW